MVIWRGIADVAVGGYPDQPTADYHHGCTVRAGDPKSRRSEVIFRIFSFISTCPLNEFHVPDFSGFHSLEEPLCCPAAAVRAIQSGLSDLGGRIYLLTASQSNCGYGAVRCERENLNSYGTQQEFNSYCNADALTADATTFADPLGGFFGAGLGMKFSLKSTCKQGRNT